MATEAVLPDGTTILVEGEAPDGPRDVSLKATIDMNQFREMLGAYASTLLEPLKSMDADEVELELSVGIELTTGKLIAFLAGAKGQTGTKVRIKWARGKH